jgi:nitroreductase
MRHNLSEITTIIKDRRTIYPEFFSDRKVHKEQIEVLLNNAIWAPSHGLTQPWRFTVMMDGALTRLSDYLSDSYKQISGEAVNEMKFSRLQERPLRSSAVIAIGMSPDPKGKIPEMEEIEAVACAVQNMHLTATAQGLAFFWSTPKFLYDRGHTEFFGFEKETKILGLIYLGYPKGEWPKGQRKPIEYISTWKHD